MKPFSKYFTTAMTVLSISCLLALAIVSCSDDDESTPDSSLLAFTITSPVETPGSVHELARTVSAAVPFGTDLSALTVNTVVSTGATVTPASGSVVNFSQGPVSFQVTKGGQTSTYLVRVTESLPIRVKVAFIGLAPDVASITEPDTKAAALWAQDQYGTNFKYLSFSQINETAVSDVKVIFWYFDDTGVDRNAIIPDAAKGDALTTLTNWYKAGGSFVFSCYATQYVTLLGRIPNSYAPVIYGNGIGGSNPDYWGLNAGTGLTADRTSHAIYANLTTTQTSNPVAVPPGSYGHDIFPLIDGGYKEDHNSMWDLNVIAELNGAPSKGAAFETNTQSIILGTWQHVTDLCCAAAVEFLPNTQYQGSCIAIGTAAYEWEMNDGRTNSFAPNVEGITANAIQYLLDK
ncbi:DUF4960 domain-containing protein [Parachryseolinea silvisoli]|uniref:DUF4960 domain-containing protein n=1 Tax=Parachryseolinea silvisoli TaxID=2873601 RepID=UPI002265EA5D|nr:DUF4960 domain-containing protein [Parachryseolinea silvisoli]MCD9017152.1 DUF4960 domain-containing protein [Parachryseolinea silvisoli]